MHLFKPTDSITDELYPARDPEVVRLQAALDAARTEAEPATKAWHEYCEAHMDDPISVPFSRQKQRVYDRFCDASWSIDDAEAALHPVMDAATQRAKVLWDDRIRQQFLDDQPAIEAFIELLAAYEATISEAQAAGVSRMLNVPNVFLTAREVAERLAYAKKELGVE
jgi:hypothetical protein